MSANSLADDSAGALRHRNRELAILNAIAAALNASVDLEASLSTVLSHVAELLGLRTGWVFLLDDDTPYLAASLNLPPGLAAKPSRMAGSCYCLDTFCRGDLAGAANVNVVTCSRLKGLVDGTGGLRCHASIPLYAQGRKLGVMNVASAEWRELSAEELRLLHTVGDLLGIAVERARAYAQSREHGALEERNRLAREIHDTLAQGLAAIALRLDTAAALLESSEAPPPGVVESLGEALGLVRDNLAEARRSVLDLRAAPLEGRRLDEALRVLASESAEAGDPRVEVHATVSGPPLPAHLEVGLYRIAAESLTNARRHAEAATVRIELEISPGRARLGVEDDGKGFEPGEAGDDRFGLLGIRERAQLLGGELEVKSAPGVGTRLDVVVPR